MPLIGAEEWSFEGTGLNGSLVLLASPGYSVVARLDLSVPRVRVERAVQEVGAKQIIGSPESDAGKRSVLIPQVIVPEVAWHLRVFTEEGASGRVFVGPKGATPLRSNFQRIWVSALTKAGVDGLHFHDYAGTPEQ